MNRLLRHPWTWIRAGLYVVAALVMAAAVTQPAVAASHHAHRSQHARPAHSGHTTPVTHARASAHRQHGTAGTSGDPRSPQPLSRADHNPGGANGKCPGGPYCSTRDGSPSLNGNGHGRAVGKPCAGCVGKADNKNPRGQYPNGSDHNAGYECDRNHGIGRSNPAHTGCSGTSASTSPPTTTCDVGSASGSGCDTTPPPGPPGQCPGGSMTAPGGCGTSSPPTGCPSPAAPGCGEVVSAPVRPGHSETGSITGPIAGTVAGPVAGGTVATALLSGPRTAAAAGPRAGSAMTPLAQPTLPNTGAPDVLPELLAGLALLTGGLALSTTAGRRRARRG